MPILCSQSQYTRLKLKRFVRHIGRVQLRVLLRRLLEQQLCKGLQCERRTPQFEDAAVGRPRMVIDFHHNKCPNKVAMAIKQLESKLS